MRLARGSLWLVVLFALCACSEIQIIENTPLAVTVRYGGVVTLEDATAAAQSACAARGKIAHLRDTEEKGVLERFAHFACVSS